MRIRIHRPGRHLLETGRIRWLAHEHIHSPQILLGPHLLYKQPGVIRILQQSINRINSSRSCNNQLKELTHPDPAKIN